MSRAWTAAAAIAAAVTGYAYAARRGVPAPIASIATIGTSAVDARGGVVLEVHLDDDPGAARATVAEVITKRLAGAGADVAIEDVDARTLRARAAGIGTAGAKAIAAGLGVRGELGMRAEVDRGDDLDVIARLAAPGMRVEHDHWTGADGRSHDVPYLVADDRAALAAVLVNAPGMIDASHDVVIEELAGDAHVKRSFRTHLLEKQALIENRDITAAEVQWDPQTNRPIVLVTFSVDGAQRFGDWTADHLGDKLAIVLDGAVKSAPIIQGAIRGGKATITMGGSDPQQQEDEAYALASTLRAGALLPVPVTARVVETFEPSNARTELARALCALVAALAALAIALGVTRWRALAAVAAPPAPGRGPIRWHELGVRGAVTLGVPALLWLIGGLDVPGVRLARLDDRGVPRELATIGALGIGAVLVAYVLAELLGLAIPAWRARRGAGRDARVPIVAAAAAIATALVVGQAYVLGRVYVFVGAASSPWLPAAALAGGVACAALGAAAIERWGLGNGWSVVIAAFVLRATAALLADAEPAAVALALGAGALVAIVALAAARTSVRGTRLPIAGFAGAALLPAALAVYLRQTGMIPGADTFAIRDRLAQPAAVVVAAAVLAALLALPWSRRAAGARGAAVAASVAIAIALTAIALCAGGSSAALAPLAIGFAAAAIADVGAEARARARTAWRDVAHTGDVDHAAELVAGGGRFARAAHVRALGRGLAPFAPIVVYEAVPPGDA